MTAINLSGQRFTRLVVVRRHGRLGSHATWLCLCDCGRETIVQSNNLKSGSIKSCGCWRQDVCRIRQKAAVPRLSTPEYYVWRSMKQRCTLPSHKSYKDYGERGITICERWLHSFDAFLEDMGPRPSQLYSIDRIENDKGYYKENCRWATASQQLNNRRVNRMLECDGRSQTQAEWAKELGVSNQLIAERLKRGWTIKNALYKPKIVSKIALCHRINV